MSLQSNELAKMIFLIKRRPDSSREELIMHWYKNHMPAVISSQKRARERGGGAHKYIAQLFDTSNKATMAWDGMAQLWFDEPQPPMKQLAGTTPSDTFQENAAPYFSWATKEYVVIDGSEKLSTAPLTLNDPYPSTRSGFFRVNYLVPAQQGVDFEKFYEHWLRVHVPNVQEWMTAANGFRYIVSHSIYPQEAPYAGMAELYFKNAEDWAKYQSFVRADGMENFVDGAHMDIMYGSTEMVGIP